jgi:ATP-dependent 26S proteasome regulatory subunit
MLPEEADYEEDFDIKELAKYDLSGGQINLIVKNTAYKVAVRENAIFSMEDFIEEIRKEKSGNFDSEKSMGFLN